MICKHCNHQLPKDSEFCQYCGEKIEVDFKISEDAIKNPGESVIENAVASTINAKTRTEVPIIKEAKLNTSRKIPTRNKIIFFSNILCIIFTLVSIFSITMAIFTQDGRREIFENYSPTTVYLIFLLLSIIFLCFAVYSFIKERFKLIFILSIIHTAAIVIIPAAFENSIYSTAYSSQYNYLIYTNNDVVFLFHVLWITCVILTLVMTTIPFIVAVIKKINISWRQSIAYRENCYRRVAKIHRYLKSGIITQEEYEKAKKDILKHIL